MFTMGHVLAIIGAALAVIGGGVGSSLALNKTTHTVSGVCAENPKLISKVRIIQLLPASQGIYGFVVAILLLMNSGLIFGGEMTALTNEDGMAYLIAALPCAITAFLSALYQAKAGCAAINMIAKEPSTSSSGLLMAAMIEFYAILGFLISLLMVI